MAKTIKDPALGNYEIVIENGFTLNKTGFTKPKEGEEPKETSKNCGYFSTLTGALNEAVKLLTIDGIGEVSTLKEYAETLKATTLDVENYFSKLNQ